MEVLATKSNGHVMKKEEATKSDEHVTRKEEPTKSTESVMIVRDHHDWVWGSLGTILFIMIWLGSIVTPFFFVYSYVQGHTEAASITAAAVCLAYAPWPSSPSISHFFGRSAQKYFKEPFSLLYEEPFVDESCPKKLLCVHPHGAFLNNRLHFVNPYFI